MAKKCTEAKSFIFYLYNFSFSHILGTNIREICVSNFQFSLIGKVGVRVGVIQSFSINVCIID